MKIPKSVRIAGVEYAVEVSADLSDGQRRLAGQIEYSKAKIRLDESLEGDALHLMLWIEIVQGIVKNAQLRLTEKDLVVEAIARGLFQVLSDNAERLGFKNEAAEEEPQCVTPLDFGKMLCLSADCGEG